MTDVRLIHRAHRPHRRLPGTHPAPPPLENLATTWRCPDCPGKIEFWRRDNHHKQLTAWAIHSWSCPGLAGIVALPASVSLTGAEA